MDTLSVEPNHVGRDGLGSDIPCFDFQHSEKGGDGVVTFSRAALVAMMAIRACPSARDGLPIHGQYSGGLATRQSAAPEPLEIVSTRG